VKTLHSACGTKAATFSDDNLARFRLSFELCGLGRLMVIALNPSKATHEVPDNTASKLERLARGLTFAGLDICNISPWRSTAPRGMLDPRAPDYDAENLEVIRDVASRANVVVAAWGVQRSPKALNEFVTSRARTIAWTLDRDGVVLRCLGVTADGVPRHPLFLRGDAKPVLWEGSRA
jgi:hypothetical protein